LNTALDYGSVEFMDIIISADGGSITLVKRVHYLIFSSSAVSNV
jgi:hypothetical protein